jgi:hypothetical protein
MLKGISTTGFQVALSSIPLLGVMVQFLILEWNANAFLLRVLAFHEVNYSKYEGIIPQV